MAQQTAKQLALTPHISEKSYALSNNRVYVFIVDMDANKLEVKDAVETQFGVTVTDVKSHIRKGKAKKSARRRTQPVDGKRADRKQVFVTLKEGDSLPLFEELN